MRRWLTWVRSSNDGAAAWWRLVLVTGALLAIVALMGDVH